MSRVDAWLMLIKDGNKLIRIWTKNDILIEKIVGKYRC